MNCPVCNAKATDGATFCQQCGAKLPPADSRMVADPLADRPAREAASATERAAVENSGSTRRRGTADVPEETLWEGSYSPKAIIGPAVGCGVLTIVLLVVALAYAEGIVRTILLLAIVVLWLLLALRLAAQRLGISYKLTNHMFYHRRGVLTRTTDRIELIEVHDVKYDQGLFDRLVNVGRITITSSDRTHPTFHMRGVENVESVFELIDKARRGEQVRRGRRIESIQVDGGA
jgi:membrane protein YdbS with pleckstrin-like domain